MLDGLSHFPMAMNPSLRALVRHAWTAVADVRSQESSKAPGSGRRRLPPRARRWTGLQHASRYASRFLLFVSILPAHAERLHAQHASCRVKAPRARARAADLPTRKGGSDPARRAE